MKKFKVYIVEDSEIVSELMKYELEKRKNYQIKVFNQPLDVLDHLSDPPDLIILDHFLGKDGTKDLFGMQILKAIKEITKNIPVLIFSGQRDIKLAVEYINIGALDYVSKNGHNFTDELYQAIYNIEKSITITENMRNIRQEALSKLQKGTIFLIILLMVGSLFLLE